MPRMNRQDFERDRTPALVLGLRWTHVLSGGVGVRAEAEQTIAADEERD
jgi:hypothetical protein